MKIKSDLLRAAMLVQAKNDVRRYLCGVRITRKHVQATNGHIALQMEHDSKVRVPVTISIKGKIPARSTMSKFEFGRDGDCNGLVKHYDALGSITAIHAIEVLEGKFPDFESGRLFGDLERFSFDNPMPAVNPEYMGLPSKLFPKDKYTSVRPAPGGTINDPLLLHFSSFVQVSYGNPQLIIMPMRWGE